MVKVVLNQDGLVGNNAISKVAVTTDVDYDLNLFGLIHHQEYVNLQNQVGNSVALFIDFTILW